MAQKVTKYFGYLDENLWPRTFKNRPIWSHCRRRRSQREQECQKGAIRQWTRLPPWVRISTTPSMLCLFTIESVFY